MSDLYYLVLCLAGPLQSWSTTASTCNRDIIETNEFPTKSGIVGMLCAALGVRKDDVTSIKKLAALKQTVHILKNGTILVDFHTIGGGYESGSLENQLFNAEGKNRNNPIITHRFYLEDAAFGVILEGDKKLLTDLSIALQDPKWSLCLGRKACMASYPIFTGLYDNKEEANEASVFLEGTRHTIKTKIEDVTTYKEGNIVLRDFPISFQDLKYTTRNLKITSYV